MNNMAVISIICVKYNKEFIDDNLVFVFNELKLNFPKIYGIKGQLP